MGLESTSNLLTSHLTSLHPGSPHMHMGLHHLPELVGGLYEETWKCLYRTRSKSGTQQTVALVLFHEMQRAGRAQVSPLGMDIIAYSSPEGPP